MWYRFHAPVSHCYISLSRIVYLLFHLNTVTDLNRLHLPFSDEGFWIYSLRYNIFAEAGIANPRLGTPYLHQQSHRQSLITAERMLTQVFSASIMQTRIMMRRIKFTGRLGSSMPPNQRHSITKPWRFPFPGFIWR